MHCHLATGLHRDMYMPINPLLLQYPFSMLAVSCGNTVAGICKVRASVTLYSLHKATPTFAKHVLVSAINDAAMASVQGTSSKQIMSHIM